MIIQKISKLVMNKKLNRKNFMIRAGFSSVLFVGIVGVSLSAVLTAEAKDWLKEKGFLKPSSLPTINSSPSTEAPLPTSAKEIDVDRKLVAQASYSRSNNIGVLTNPRVFSDRVTSQNQENVYFFSLAQPSNISLYLDNVTSSVGMRLYVDTNGNGSIDSGESVDSRTAYSSSAGVIKRTLGGDNYIVVVKFSGGNSAYNLQIVNNTNDAINVGSLKGTRNFTGSINRNTREKYYRFSLSNPSDVRLSLDNVTNSLGMRLYVDTNGNGVIDSGESVDSRTAYSSSAGVIRRRLGADNYFVIIGGSGGNTNYRLTMFAP